MSAPDLQLSIKELQEIYIVSLGEKTLFTIKKNDHFAIKMGIISMVNTGLFKQVDLAKSFHLHRDTIANYLKAYEKSGLTGLIERQPGPQGIPEEIEKRIIKLLLESAKRVEIPKIILQEFGKSISRTKVYEIRKKYLSEIKKIQVKEPSAKKK